jgi:hypothetical protein
MPPGTISNNCIIAYMFMIVNQTVITNALLPRLYVLNIPSRLPIRYNGIKIYAHGLDSAVETIVSDNVALATINTIVSVISA